LKLCSWILNKVGGRVIPITLEGDGISPFLLLAHHTHSFTPFDPIRALTTFILPEGFPAHPHSGFDTVTYCIDGGLCHRDSEGIQMKYGNGDVQWMRAGRGVIHEEMWDNSKHSRGHNKIEIFQLWVNLPKKRKLDDPAVSVLKSSEIPIWVGSSGERIRLISGNLFEKTASSIPLLIGPGTSIAASPINIMHATIPLRKSLSLSIPLGCSAMVYLRRGSLETDNGKATMGDCIYYRKPDIALSSVTADEINSLDATLSLDALDDDIDALILLGMPLNEPVIWRGPYVQASGPDIMASARAFESIGMSGFWDYRLSDKDWKEHINKLNLQNIITQFLNM
jgi:redox-sensitive bicupin YhaK (pirin superfamily)